MGTSIQNALILIEQGLAITDFNLYNVIMSPDDGQDELRLAVHLLLNVNNPYAIEPSKRSALILEESIKHFNNIHVKFAECLLRAKHLAIEAFTPIIDSMNFAPDNIEWLDLTLDLMWSKNPSCFEKQLQRMYNNPLFPKKKRIFPQSIVDQPQKKDIEDLNNLSLNLNDFKK